MTTKFLRCQLLMCVLAAAQAVSLSGADETACSAKESTSSSDTATDQIAQLKKLLLSQQAQIDELRRALDQRKPVSMPSNKLGDVASTTPLVPAAVAAAPATQGGAAETSPLQLKIGDASITPVGFMDFTSVTRSTNAGGSIGTNFGSIPYANTTTGSLTESRLSPQNSRIGFRVDALVKDVKVLGYMESDFLGQTGNPPNGGIAVSSNSYPLRLRLYWVDLRKNKFEVLAGQSWSMMTPNRVGISPLPGDIFYSQNIDVNYQLGLVWGRIPGFRVLYHPSDKTTFGIALENSEPYVGGANGSGAITAPTALASILGGSVNNGSSVLGAAALHPDIIAKLAFDPTPKFHLEVAGVEISNRIANPTNFQTFTKAGGAGAINLNFQAAKHLRLLTNNYWGDGGGRYIFGQAPDFMIRSNGSMSLIHSGSTVGGFEATAGRTLYYGYYGGVFIERNTALDANGKSLIGYGFTGSSSGQNRAIQEITFGSNTTLWKDARYGALNLMFQYSYLERNPWYVASGQPSDAHVQMGFVNMRYTLPGSAPAVK